MTVQFNLLPDVKQQYIKANRNKRLVMLVSFFVAGGMFAIMVIMFLTVQVFQRQHINNLSHDILSSTNQLKSTPDLDKILTVQNQLNSLTCSTGDLADSTKPCLHDRKPAAIRLYSYLPKITPRSVSMSKLDVDFSQHTMIFTGNADALSSVNKFVDTLKFTTYSIQGSASSRSTFSNVVLTSFSLNSQEKDPKKKAQFQINLNFDPAIFDNSQTVNLKVPSLTTTRSVIDRPLFQSTSNTRNQ